MTLPSNLFISKISTGKMSLKFVFVSIGTMYLLSISPSVNATFIAFSFNLEFLTFFFSASAKSVTLPVASKDGNLLSNSLRMRVFKPNESDLSKVLPNS